MDVDARASRCRRLGRDGGVVELGLGRRLDDGHLGVRCMHRVGGLGHAWGPATPGVLRRPPAGGARPEATTSLPQWPAFVLLLCVARRALCPGLADQVVRLRSFATSAGPCRRHSVGPTAAAASVRRAITNSSGYDPYPWYWNTTWCTPGATVTPTSAGAIISGVTDSPSTVADHPGSNELESSTTAVRLASTVDATRPSASWSCVASTRPAGPETRSPGA